MTTIDRIICALNERAERFSESLRIPAVKEDALRQLAYRMARKENIQAAQLAIDLADDGGE